jgi:hypothetical protein
VFSSNLTTPDDSFSAALRGSATQQHPQAQQVPGETTPHSGAKLGTQIPGDQQKTGQSVRAPTIGSQPLDNMIRVVTVAQQIMTEFSGAVSEKDKIVAITKIVLNLMKQDGHYSS